MSVTVPGVWIAAGGGRDIVRADAIVMLRLDATGRLTAQLRDDAKVSVTLLEGSAETQPPEDFHRQMIRAVAQLADSSGAHLVRAHLEGGVWRWRSELL
jgi:hypothetical protein